MINLVAWDRGVRDAQNGIAFAGLCPYNLLTDKGISWWGGWMSERKLMGKA